MKAYYNLDGAGDTLFVQLMDLDKAECNWTRIEGITRITEKETGKTAGYNIFNPSEYGSVSGKGRIEFNAGLVELINTALARNGIEESVEQE
ncbi:hypothetical protein CR205_00750 [Alteribacter lacisalsi]|jgi:tRNA-binding protein|uniref:DUF4479 domain-containing protein n=1 Tax=Alteribacter lacisalsi TaxID=2045244 RepID=A0A2W0H5P1_9BACI|nr:DUF4479 family protein [Alteribacter lacisalsi]PYZ97164.1 hypothetical protein CR205_00750 [Alteribacter lacisalsi]